MLIGQLSAKSGVSRDTIRYYEKIGLIRADGFVRQSNSYKDYSEQTLQRLRHILELKTAGFTLAEISGLLEALLQDEHPCTELPTKLHHKIRAIDKKISALENQKHSMQKILVSCDSNCAIQDGLPSCIACQ